MNPEHEQQLRQLFRQQREADAQRVPAFSRVTRAPEPPGLPWWQGATVAVAVVLLAVAGALWRRPVTVNAEPWAALGRWQAATDALLTVASTPWGGMMTAPSDSLFETTTATQPKETIR